eukprot:scaffold352035_cov18-Prasinocladus_malaysianus.AAC.1
MNKYTSSASPDRPLARARMLRGRYSVLMIAGGCFVIKCLLLFGLLSAQTRRILGEVFQPLYCGDVESVYYSLCRAGSPIRRSAGGEISQPRWALRGGMKGAACFTDGNGIDLDFALATCQWPACWIARA